MNHPEVVFRPAVPTDRDGLRFASYMNQAADGGFQKMFGKRFEEIVSAAYREPNHDLSYETALFAKTEEAIVGMVSGYSAEQYQQFRKDVVDQVAGRSRFRIWLIFSLIAPMMRFLHTYDEGDFYVEFLAVDEAHRGQGIGTKLLQALEDRAHSNGSSQLAIDVARRNKVAVRLYEHYGFKTIRQWPKTRLMKPNILRMTKPL